MFFLYLSLCLSVDSSCCVLLSQCLLTHVGWQFYCQFTVLYGSGISKVDGPWVGYLWVLLFEDGPVWNGHLAVTTKGFLGDSDRNKSNPERCFVVHDSHTTTGAANQAPDLKVEKGEGLCLTHFLVLGFLVPWSFSHFLWTTLFICLCMYVMNVRRCYMYMYMYIYIYIHYCDHFYNLCRVGPSTPDLWCITVATQASFLYF